MPLQCIIWKEVNSSNIRGIYYDEEHQVLSIQFKGAKFEQYYSYSPVPLEVWKDFESAQSKGKYFHTHIKSNKNYNCEIMEDFL